MALSRFVVLSLGFFMPWIHAFQLPRAPFRPNQLFVSTLGDNLTTGSKSDGLDVRALTDHGDHTTKEVGAQDQTKNELTSLQRVFQAATKHPSRLLHPSMGLLSIGVGVAHVGYCLANGWDAPIDVNSIVATTIVHTSTAVIGLTRIGPFKQAERARTAQIAPIFLFNGGLGYLSLSEWSQGSHAVVSMYDPRWVGFELVVLGVTLWQLQQAWMAALDPVQQRTGLWYEDQPVKTTLFVFWSMQYVNVWSFCTEMWTHFRTSVDPTLWIDVIDRHPGLGHLIANINLDAQFAYNLGVFAVTLFKYKAIDRTALYYSSILFDVVVTLFYVFPTLFSIDGGEAWREWLACVMG